MSDEKNISLINKLKNELTFEKPEENTTKQSLSGINVVITGSLEHFSSRTILKNIIENMGGKVTGSVTGKTNYLINNDVSSGSSKNKKAKELGVTIVSENDFIDKFQIDY